MKKKWDEKIQVSDLGQQFSFDVSSEYKAGEKLVYVDFTDQQRQFTIQIIWLTETDTPDHRYTVSPEKSLSDSNLAQLVEQHLEPFIQRNKKHWKD
jgi:hypothetical protein